MTDKGLFLELTWEWQTCLEDGLHAFYKKFSKAGGPTMIGGTALFMVGLLFITGGSIILGSTLLILTLYIFAIDAFQRKRRSHHG